MKIVSYRGQAVCSITFQYRNQTVDAIYTNGSLQINFKFDGVLEGGVTLNDEEIATLVKMLEAFFLPPSEQGRFNCSTKEQRCEMLPLIRLSTTNWGNPFANGVRFEFSNNFDDYTKENLHFDLEESDVNRFKLFLSTSLNNQ